MRIDSTGVTPTPMEQYVEQFEDEWRSAFGPAVNLQAESPQGQHVGISSVAWANADEVVVSVAEGMNPNTAVGRQLDAMFGIMLVERIEGERSIVTVTLTGAVGTIIEQGRRARTSDGAVFSLDARVIIGVTGSEDATMRSVENGPIVALAGGLNVIVDAVTGWTGVTNALAAQLGRNEEGDFGYRRRYNSVVAHNGRGSIEHIEAHLRSIEGVTDARVVDNDSRSDVTVQSIALPAGSVLSIVEGGADSDVAEAILRSKSVGISTVGTQSVVVAHANFQQTTVNFMRVENEPISVSVTSVTNDRFPTDGEALMKQRLVDWVGGDFQERAGYFETEGLRIGETLDVQRLLTPIQSVPGHIVTDYEATLQNGSVLPTEQTLNKRYTLAYSDVTVMIS